jgi:ribosomal protein L11 methylase PrmA
MITEHDQAMSHLHSRAVRGEALSDSELAQLRAWHMEQDVLEAAELQIPSVSPIDLQALQKDLDQALLRLARATQYVQELSDQNSVLRQQIAELERRLARRVPKAA